MADCLHGLDTEWCATCKYGPQKRGTEVHVSMPFIARYRGRCRDCDELIVVGDSVVTLTVDDHTSTLHEGCA